MINFFNQSFKRELFLSFVIVACVPLLFTDLSLTNVFKNWVTHNDEKKAALQLQQIESSLTTFLEEIEATGSSLSHNGLLIEGLKKEDALVKNRAYRAFYTETSRLRTSVVFSIYDQGGICQFATSSKQQPEKMLSYWGILKRAQTKPDEMIFEKSYALTGESADSLQGARVIIDENDECLGFIVVTINSDSFKSILEGTYDEQDGIVIMDHFWEEVYSTQKRADIAKCLRSRHLNEAYSPEGLKDIDYYMEPLNEWHFYVLLYKDSIFTEDFTKKLRLTLGLMTAGSILWCIFAVGVVSGFVTKPIQRLAYAMHEVEEGNLAFRVKSQRKDEIGQLSRSFDKMADTIDASIKLQVAQQKKLNESQVALMQAQLNPHFLYNTLDTMKWVAKANHIPEMVTLAGGLAKILRTSISGRPFIPLSKELHLVEAYINIQKIRFSGKFSFDVEVEPELEDCMVPKLVIQPIVENAVVHGLKESECGHIFMNIHREEDKLVIDIYDDGCGIEEDTLAALNSHDRERLKGHIGFYNVDAMIRLNYGTFYGIRAENQKSGGTKVQIVLPINGGEGMKDV